MKYQWVVLVQILEIPDYQSKIFMKKRKQRNQKEKKIIVEVFAKECELKTKRKLFQNVLDSKYMNKKQVKLKQNKKMPKFRFLK